MNKDKYAWKNYKMTPCIDCGKERLVHIVKGVPISLRCKSCSVSMVMKGHSVSQETRDKISVSLIGHKGCCSTIGKHLSEETRNKMSVAKKGKTSPNKGNHASESVRTKMKIAAKLRWEDKEYINNTINAFYNNVKNRKSINYNLSEQSLDKIIQENCPNQYKYNGIGQLGFRIYRHTPDFVNVDGQKKIIELNGCAWHMCDKCGKKHPCNKSKESIRERDGRNIINAEKLGYSVLVVWEHELKDKEKLAKKIAEFNNVRVEHEN